MTPGRESSSRPDGDSERRPPHGPRPDPDDHAAPDDLDATDDGSVV